MNERNGLANERISTSHPANFYSHRSSPSNSPPTSGQPCPKNPSLDIDPPDHFAELCALLENPQHFQALSNDSCASSHLDHDVSGLHFEVEIDESLQELINWSNDQKKRKPAQSKLMQPLDVIIMPEDESKQTIVSLGVEEVSQLISIVNSKGSRNRASMISKENKESFNQVKHSQHGSPRLILPRNLANDPVLRLYAGCDSTEDEERSHTDDAYRRNIIPNNTQQVYTTPKHTIADIKAKLPCMSKSRTSSVVPGTEKPGTACLCQHCGMVGVLVESQKRPAIPHTPNPKFTGNTNVGIPTPRPRKTADLKTKSKSETNLLLLKELTTKVASLESRLTEQEESAVKKDYFKFVIHRLITQYATKINELKVSAATPVKPSNNMATQYTTKPLLLKERPRRKSGEKETLEKSNDHLEQYLADRQHPKKPVQMRKATRSTDVKTVLMTSDVSAQHLPHDVSEVAEKGKIGVHAVKDLCDMVYHKYCLKSSHAAGNEEKAIPEALLKGGAPPRTQQDPPKRSNAGVQQDQGQQSIGSSKNRCETGAKHVDVAYVSPALKTWHEESEQELIMAGTNKLYCSPNATVRSARNKSQAKHAIDEKISYLRYLAKRKKVDETELWNNILDQAKRHIKSNDDTVSIQLPHLLNGPKLSELELTLTKLNEIVKECRNVKKVPSGFSMDNQYHSSVESLELCAKTRRNSKHIC